MVEYWRLSITPIPARGVGLLIGAGPRTSPENNAMKKCRVIRPNWTPLTLFYPAGIVPKLGDTVTLPDWFITRYPFAVEEVVPDPDFGRQTKTKSRARKHAGGPAGH